MRSRVVFALSLLVAPPVSAQVLFSTPPPPPVECTVVCGKDGADGRDGVDGRDGRDAPTPEVIRETYMHADWEWPVTFVPGVDRMLALVAATPDRLPLILYYYRAPGPFQGYLFIVDANRDRDYIVALKRGGEVPLWSDIGSVQERTLVFVGPTKSGVTHTCLINITTLLTILESRPGGAAIRSSLSAWVVNGVLPRVTLLDDAELHTPR